MRNRLQLRVPAATEASTGVTRELVRLALPIVGLNLAHTLLGVIDTLFLGHLGTAAVASAGLGNLVFLSPYLLLRGTINGVIPFVSRAYGAGDLRAGGEHLRDFLWLAIGLGLLGGLLYPFFGVVIGLMAPEPAVLEGSLVFARIRILEVLPGLVSAALLSFLVSTGDSRTPMLVTWGTVALNVFFNWVLVFGNLGFPALGLRGSALGTATAVTIQAVVAIVVVLHRRNRARFAIHFEWPSVRRTWRLLRVSAPAGLTDFVDVSAFAVFFGMLGRLGTAELAASQIANQVASTAFMPGFALSTATASLVGRALGAGDESRARRVGFRGVAVGMAFMGLVGVGFLLLARPLVLAFNNDPEVLALGTSLMRLMAVWQALDAAGIIFRGALIGAGDTRFAALVTAISGWVLMLPGAYFLAFVLDWGLLGAWGGPLLFVTFAGTANFLRFRSGVWAKGRI